MIYIYIYKIFLILLKKFFIFERITFFMYQINFIDYLVLKTFVDILLNVIFLLKMDF